MSMPSYTISLKVAIDGISLRKGEQRYECI